MKKSLIVLFFLNFFIYKNLQSFEFKPNDWKTKIGETITGEFKSTRKRSFPLEEGTWTLIDRSHDDIYATIFSEELFFVQFINDVPQKWFSIGKIDNLGKWVAYISTYINAEVFNSKNAFCRLKQHYNYIKFYKKGFAHNCMVVTITDVKRELYPSDYDSNSDYTASLRKWIKDNNIKMPDLYLEYSASFHAMSVEPTWYVIGYGETPEIFANYKPKYTSRDTTEFHPDKINNYPEAKKIMKNWLEKSAIMQKNFENLIKVKKYHKIDLKDIMPKINEIKKIDEKDINISDQIIKLNDLYNKGIITKNEFEKAKSKVLK